MPDRRYVLTTRVSGAERTLAVDELEPGAYVLEDVTAARRLGELRGDATPFLLDGEHVVWAGWVEPRDEVDHVALEVRRPVGGGDLHDEQRCKVGNGVWLGVPVRFEAGMTVELSLRRADGGEVYGLTSEPLTPERLAPAYGPRWAGVAIAGEPEGDLVPSVRSIGGAPHLVCAGPDRDGADAVVLAEGLNQTCPVRDGRWTSEPEPFAEGMVVTAVWLRGGRELFRLRTPPLRAGALAPVSRGDR